MFISLVYSYEIRLTTASEHKGNLTLLPGQCPPIYSYRLHINLSYCDVGNCSWLSVIS